MARTYEHLNVWKDSMDLIEDVYRITSSFPKQELFGIVSQVRRSAVSITSNIAEGSGRSSKKDYCRFIDMAVGSLNETENILRISLRLSYITEKEFSTLNDKILKIGNSLGAFRRYLKR